MLTVDDQRAQSRQRGEEGRRQREEFVVREIQREQLAAGEQIRAIESQGVPRQDQSLNGRVREARRKRLNAVVRQDQRDDRGYAKKTAGQTSERVASEIDSEIRMIHGSKELD